VGIHCVMGWVSPSVKKRKEMARVKTYRKPLTTPKIMAALPIQTWMGANLVGFWVFLYSRWCTTPNTNWARMNMKTIMPMTWWAVLKFLVCPAVQPSSQQTHSFYLYFPRPRLTLL
jgi:hypothetical protein